MNHFKIFLAQIVFALFKPSGNKLKSDYGIYERRSNM